MAILKKTKNMVFKTHYRLMQVKSIAECSKRSTLEHSAILSAFMNYQLSLRPLFCLFLSGHFTQVFLFITSMLYIILCSLILYFTYSRIMFWNTICTWLLHCESFVGTSPKTSLNFVYYSEKLSLLISLTVQ